MTQIVPITTTQIMQNDGYRNAFGSITRRALPYMDSCAYHTDLLHDAATAAQLEPEERIYILVRKLGTNVFKYGDDAIDMIDKTDGQAVLRVIRGPYDTFAVDVIHG